MGMGWPDSRKMAGKCGTTRVPVPRLFDAEHWRADTRRTSAASITMAHEETNPNESRQPAAVAGLEQALADAVQAAALVPPDGGRLTPAVRDAVARAAQHARAAGVSPEQLLAALDVQIARAPADDHELRGRIAALLLRAHVAGDGTDAVDGP